MATSAGGKLVTSMPFFFRFSSKLASWARAWVRWNLEDSAAASLTIFFSAADKVSQNFLLITTDWGLYW